MVGDHRSSISCCNIKYESSKSFANYADFRMHFVFKVVKSIGIAFWNWEVVFEFSIIISGIIKIKIINQSNEKVIACMSNHLLGNAMSKNQEICKFQIISLLSKLFFHKRGHGSSLINDDLKYWSYSFLFRCNNWASNWKAQELEAIH